MGVEFVVPSLRTSSIVADCLDDTGELVFSGGGSACWMILCWDGTGPVEEFLTPVLLKMFWPKIYSMPSWSSRWLHRAMILPSWICSPSSKSLSKASGDFGAVGDDGDFAVASASSSSPHVQKLFSPTQTFGTTPSPICCS